MAASAPKRVKTEDVGERSWVGLISLINSRVDADSVDRVTGRARLIRTRLIRSST